MRGKDWARAGEWMLLFKLKPLKSLRFRRNLRVCCLVLAWGGVELKLNLRLTGKSDGVPRSPGR